MKPWPTSMTPSGASLKNTWHPRRPGLRRGGRRRASRTPGLAPAPVRPGTAMNDCGPVQRKYRPSVCSLAWKRTTCRSSSIADVERESRRTRPIERQVVDGVVEVLAANARGIAVPGATAYSWTCTRPSATGVRRCGATAGRCRRRRRTARARTAGRRLREMRPAAVLSGAARTAPARCVRRGRRAAAPARGCPNRRRVPRR